MPSLDDRLLPVFARQHWLVTTADIRAAGGGRQAASSRIRAGRWERADRGVFRLSGVPPSWHGRVLAPLLSTGPPAVASHFAAAVLHGIPGFRQGAPEITIPRGAGHRRPDAIVHTSTDLQRCNRVDRDSIPVTDLSRTLLDIGRKVQDRRLLEAIEWARRERDLSWNDLVSTLARHARRGRPGIQRMRRVILANIHRDEVTDSTFELLVLAYLAEQGLPTPVLHHQVHDGRRFVAEVDLAYPQWRIAIELDGAVHLQRAVRERDLARQNDLVLLGWTVLRFSWRRFVERPDLVLAEIQAAIAAAGGDRVVANL
jgi:very-short-patch-repair endonuclease